MNAERRKKLGEIAEALIGAKADLEELQQAEQDAFDNMPEGLQQGDKGQASEAAAETIESAVGSLDEAISAIEEAQT